MLPSEKFRVDGLTVIRTRPMTKREIAGEGWDRGGTAIVFSNGTVVYASRDDEGNDCGALFGYIKGGERFAL